MNAVDTNILIYARDPRDANKQQRAIELIRSIDNGVLLWQVCCEYIAASRKLSPASSSASSAFEDICDLRMLWRSAIPSWTAFARAEALMQACSVSFWDAMIIAAALEAGATTLFTEDFAQHQAFSPLRIVNPFANG